MAPFREKTRPKPLNKTKLKPRLIMSSLLIVVGTMLIVIALIK